MTITHTELTQIVSYDKETGHFMRLSGRGSETPDRRVGCVYASSGYRYITIFSIRYREHRLAWFYHYGEWPAGELDHINRDRSDNRIANLRIVSRSENLSNRKKQRQDFWVRLAEKSPVASASGYRGVQFCKKSGRWRADMKHRGKSVHLGRFPDPKSAHQAYVAAVRSAHGCATD